MHGTMAYLKGFKTVSYYQQDGQVCSSKSNFRAAGQGDVCADRLQSRSGMFGVGLLV